MHVDSDMDGYVITLSILTENTYLAILEGQAKL